MDTELLTQILALLTAGWTAWQEYRHRKAAKARKASASMSDALGAKPVRGRK